LTFYIIPVEKFLAQTIYYFRQINKAIYFLFFRLFSNIHIQTAFPANHNRDHDQANASSKTFDGGRSNAVSLPERSVDPEHRGWSVAEIPLSGAAGSFKRRQEPEEEFYLLFSQALVHCKFEIF
jgi:hypothetical protein